MIYSAVSKSDSYHSRRGFTLTEILLVICIIAILAAILIPLFIHCKNLSYKSRCSSNLRQLYVAFNLYSQDWNSYWPCPGGLIGNRSYWSQSGLGGLNAYVKQTGVGTVWCCPHLKQWGGQYSPRSYSMNSYLRTPCDIEYPTCLTIILGINTSVIMDQKKTILLFEGIPLTNGHEDRLDYIYRCANWSRVRGYTDNIAYTIHAGQPWHGETNNYLYCDGHIVSRQPGRHTIAVLSTYKEMKEWYVNKPYYEDIYQKNWAKLIPRD